MTSFEFVFGMISVITSLALTRLLGGGVELLRHAARVRPSFRHACWTANAAMVLVGNWASFWNRRGIESWGAMDVLMPLVFIGVLYAFCALLVPDAPRDGETLDLREYHTRHGRRYVATHLVFALLALLAIAVRSTSAGAWLHDASFALAATALTVIALVTRRAWLDILAAIALVALSAGFMWSRLETLAR